jgi:hypothetical protein
MAHQARRERREALRKRGLGERADYGNIVELALWRR